MNPTGLSDLDLPRIKHLYEWAEQRPIWPSLPLEHFMESTPQATQRKITLESFDLIYVSRKDVQCFNELLVQYPIPGKTRTSRGRSRRRTTWWSISPQADRRGPAAT